MGTPDPRPYRFDLLPVKRYVTERPGLPGRRIVSYYPGALDPATAVENILALLEASGANTVYLAEDAFFSRPRRAEAFCAALRARAPGIAWIADARPQDLEDRPGAFWDLLTGSGLLMLRLGLEPGPPVPDALLETCRRRGILAECAVSEAEDPGAMVAFLDRVMRANPANKILVLNSRGEGSSPRHAFLQRVHHYAWMPEELKAAYRRKGRPMAAFYANHLLARLRWRLRLFAFPVEHWFGESGANRLLERPLSLFSRLAGGSA